MRAIYTLENVLYRLGDRHAALSEEEMATFEIRNGRNVLNGLSKRRGAGLRGCSQCSPQRRGVASEIAPPRPVGPSDDRNTSRRPLRIPSRHRPLGVETLSVELSVNADEDGRRVSGGPKIAPAALG